jgi:DNA transformation protein
MSWSAPSEPLVAVFNATLATQRRIERRTLFGAPAAYLAGHLVATVFRDQFVLRLGDADRDALHAGRTPVPFEPLPGRAMRELYVVPRAVVADPPERARWFARAMERVAEWPPKGAVQTAARRPTAQPGPAADPLQRLGPKSREWLERAGIEDFGQLREMGAVRAYLAVKRTGARPSLNLLWALEGLLTGQRWQDVAREHRTSLLLALEDAIAIPPGMALDALAELALD